MKLPRETLSERGFSLIELMIAGALSMLMVLGAVMVQNYQNRGSVLSWSQNSNNSLASALRARLSRRETCLSSFSVRPASLTAPSEVAVRLGPGAGEDEVRAGRELKRWKLRVSSLVMKNITHFGTANNGNQVFLGDITLKSESAELEPGSRVSFKELQVVRLTLEVNGAGTILSCYSGAYSDTTQQLQYVCGMVVSPTGVPGMWVGGRCVVSDYDPAATCAAQGGSWDGVSCIQSPMKTCTSQGNYWDGASCIPPPAKICALQGGVWDGSTCAPPPARTCASLGGNWNGSRCTYPKESVIVVRGVNYGNPGGVWYGAGCPAGTVVSGGTCHSGSGPAPDLGGSFYGNSFYCAWPPGYESTQYNVYSACLK